MFKCRLCDNNLYSSLRSLCSECSRIKTSNIKIGRIRTQIKKYVKEGLTKEEIKILAPVIKQNAKHFHDDIETVNLIIDNFFDKNIKLPLMQVNYI
jgi:hypothetical protein